MKKELVVISLVLALFLIGCAPSGTPEGIPPIPEEALAGQAYYWQMTAEQLAAGVSLDQGWNGLTWPLEDTTVQAASAEISDSVQWVYVQSEKKYYSISRASSLSFMQNERYYLYMRNAVKWKYTPEVEEAGCEGEGSSCVVEGLVGACAEGRIECASDLLINNLGLGAATRCVPLVEPAEELCDGQDNDCDGKIDETFAFQDDPNNCGSCGVQCTEEQECLESECTVVKKINGCQELDVENALYVLENDIHMEDPIQSCFFFRRDNIILDCQGHSIIRDDHERYGASTLPDLNGVTVRGCHFSGFARAIKFSSVHGGSITDNVLENSLTGIFLVRSDGITLSRNTADNNIFTGIKIQNSENNVLIQNSAQGNLVNDGFSVSGGLSGHTFTGNTACGNARKDFFCAAGSSVSGEDNTFREGNIHQCDDNWPEEGVHYEECSVEIINTRPQ
ncbi:MAG: hypothetical protein CMH61_03005 [Nanoarchaeota archaeon]|nr:hypothetical protein [Nanoarchaeota archaeon]|tara:strand:+ start:74 stop:1423 length:1350 start_codon:yes stop_codon:yes gene_type:complete